MSRLGFTSPLRRGAGMVAALLLLIAAVPAALCAQAAPAGNDPWSPIAVLHSATQQFVAAHDDVSRLVALYRIEELNTLTQPAAMLAMLDQLATTPGLSPLLQAELQADVAGEQLSAGHGEAAADIWRRLGEVENWEAVGPFDNSSPAAIATAEGPEKGIDLNAHYQGKQRQVGWRQLPYPDAIGILFLNQFFTPAESASAYLVTWVNSPSEQTVALRLRDSGATRLWVNGAVVFDEQVAHSPSGFDQEAVPARLVAGWNEILAKVGNTESADWGFALRITAPDGQPVVLESQLTPHARPAAAAVPAGITVADLTAQAKAASASGGAALLNYAWVLTHKRNFNTADKDDVHAFEAAVAALPNDAGALLDLAEHDSDQSRREDDLEKLLAQNPANRAAHLDRGWIEMDRNEFWPARQDFEAALGLTETAVATPNAGTNPPPPIPDAGVLQQEPQAALGMLDAYAGMGIRPIVLAWAAAMRSADVTAVGIAEPAASTLHRMGADDAAAEWFALADAADRGNPDVGADLAAAQQRRGEFDDAAGTLTATLALDGQMPELLEMQANALAGLGREPAALEAIGRAARLDPDNPDFHVAAGELERRFGHAELAVQDWQQALALNPQDSELRDRLTLARGGESEESFEKPYAVGLDQAVADYKKQATPALESGPVVVLSDTTVTRIFPSGNVGRYAQQIFRINNESGAQSLATYAVTYDPDVESVEFLTAHVLHADGTSADAPEAGDAPVDEAVGYETFYNVRNKYVQMPPMRPGDFVEIAYRVLPTSLESLYGDYYGDLEPFGSPAATLLQQFVVIVPDAKKFYYKAIRFNGQASEETSGPNRVYKWTARNMPAYVEEPSAPPMIEELPYVEVSSFQTWDQFATWYTQLIRDTFTTDADLVQTVNSLVKGKTTTEEKVDAIYRWVIQNTHYVALEFGIHGYRPYPVTQVFHRRFGDCKDKASLLIAMLNQAGIPADFVLVRIRDLGLIDPTIPAVADFDHAIVYVPSLNRYLDGTAEFTGADELPDGDQRAFVLRIPVLQAAVTPAGAAPALSGLAPVVTAELPPSRDSVARTLTGRLDSQGNLQFQMHWVLTGGRAPVYRASLELADRRTGALQAMLHDRLPGISVIDAQVSDEDAWDQPLAFDFEGEIPRFATVSGNTLLLPRQILPQAWLPQMAALSERQQPELNGPPHELEETIDITLPDGFQAVAPAPVTLDRPFASFSASATVHGNQLEMKSDLVVRQSFITVAEYGAFRQFWSQVDATLGRPIASAADRTQSPAPGPGAAAVPRR